MILGTKMPLSQGATKMGTQPTPRRQICRMSSKAIFFGKVQPTTRWAIPPRGACRPSSLRDPSPTVKFRLPHLTCVMHFAKFPPLYFVPFNLNFFVFPSMFSEL